MGMEKPRRKSPKLNDLLTHFIEDESGKGNPPTTEGGKKILRAAVLGTGVITGLANIPNSNDTGRPAPTEHTSVRSQEQLSLDAMIENIANSPIDAISRDNFTAEELKCLTDNVYHEARGEPLEGRYAVIFATLSRVLEKNYPKTICGVVHQPWQFSWTKDEKILAQPINAREYLKISLEIHGLLKNRDLSSATAIARMKTGLPHGAIFYKQVGFTGSKAVQEFFSTLQHVGAVGTHDFFIKQGKALAKKEHPVKTAPSPAPLPRPAPHRAGRNRGA